MAVRLEHWRRQRLLTQRELAAKAGVGVASVARIEAGEKARVTTLRKLATALGITPEQLMGDDDSADSSAAA